MTDTLTPSATAARSSNGRRLVRSATAVASSGLLVGIGAASAAPAFAAEATDCVAGNTVTSTANPADIVAIQALLDANTAIVCLSGTFVLASTLTFDHNLTLFGLAPATLDGNDVTRMLTGSSAANLTVQNLTFVDGNSSAGGAIAVDGVLTVENSVFSSNESSGDGGAILLAGSAELVISGSTFSDNTAGNDGGAIYSDDTVEIADSTFERNQATRYGGAVLGNVIITETSVFDENSAAEGGALYGLAVLTVESTFSSNTALVGPGGAVRSLAYAATFGSTFVDNSSAVAGGAIAAGGLGMQGTTYGGVFSLNSTFVDNTAGLVGGAIFTEYGQIGLSTFLDNEAGSDDVAEHSEAIFVDAPEDAMVLAGNIFAGSRTNAQLGASDPAYLDGGGNIFSTPQSTEAALGTPDASTLFALSVTSIFGPSPELADNGGATETVALDCTSPAIDAVPASALVDFGAVSAPTLAPAQELLASASEFTAVVETSDVDQRNVDRTGLADAGAFENDTCELLAATGAEPATTGWLVGLAALLLGSGAAVALGGRRRAEVAVRTSARS